MKNTIHKKIPVLFSRPQKIPASFIDPKKSLLAKMSDPTKSFGPPPPPSPPTGINICEWGLQGQLVGPGEKGNFYNCAFSPSPTDCPWVSEDDYYCDPYGYQLHCRVVHEETPYKRREKNGTAGASSVIKALFCRAGKLPV